MKTTRTNQVYRLGKVVFCLDTGEAKAAQREWIRDLFREDKTISTLNGVLVLDGGDDVRLLINQILGRHENVIWIDSACLLSPCGKQILISGLSGAGKTTTAIALIWGHGYKSFGDDVILLEQSSRNERANLIPFTPPFSLKPGTLERLQTVIDSMPAPLVDEEWIAYIDDQIATNALADFDFAYHFESATAGQAFAVDEITRENYLRKILRCSNLMHRSEALDSMQLALANTRCFAVTGGTVSERLELVLKHE